MRTLNDSILSHQYDNFNEPFHVIEIAFDSAGTDLVYITTRADAPTPVGAVVFPGWASDLSGTSQEIDPATAHSTIGDFSFSVLDVDGTFAALLKAKDDANKGLRQCRVRVYFGYMPMTWTETSDSIICTQLIEDVFTRDSDMKFVCSDILRTTRQNIFTLNKTTLSRDIDNSQLLIPVNSVDNWQRLKHGPTFSDAPNVKVGYFQIEDEIVRWTGTTTDGTLGLCFVADKRGALGTLPAPHNAAPSTAAERGTIVEEVVYIEMPAIEALYGLLTGSYYSYPGEYFPDNWNLAIAGQYIRLSDYVNFGKDVWDPANPADSFILRFVGEKEQDAKAFLQAQVYLPSVAAPIVYGNGELGVKRLTPMLANAPYVLKLDTSNIISYTPLHQNMKAIRNVLSIQWNYELRRAKLTRQKILVDQQSRTKYKKAPALTFQFRGLHGSRHTTTILEKLFDRLRDRWAGPPEEFSITCQPWVNNLEVGDVVLVDLPSVKDYFLSGVTTDGGFLRSMEIQRVDHNWETGEVTFKLFGSTQPAGTIAPEDPNQPGGGTPSVSVIPDADYDNLGVNLATYPGVTISVTGGVGHITGGTGIVGGNTFDAGRFYYLGDLELDAGVVLPVSKNVQIWTRGYHQINGKYDLKGKGQAGGAAPGSSNPDQKNLGIAGYIGPTYSAGGVHSLFMHASSVKYTSYNGWQVNGAVNLPPALDLRYNAATYKLDGLPVAGWGTSGSSGHNLWYQNGDHVRAGGAGGNSGGSLVLVGRGISFGVSGEIDVSGNDGLLGTDYGDKIWSGSGGGGAPGLVVFVIDGLASDLPGLEAVTAKYGVAPIPTGVNIMPSASSNNYRVSTPVYPYYVGYSPDFAPDLSGFNGAARVIVLPPPNTPIEDVPDVSQAPLTITVEELPNTPPSAAGNLSTLEVTTTPPSDPAYSFSRIYYRVVGQKAWYLGTSASPEGLIVVATDGTQYELEARSVSLTGVESPSGPRVVITVSDVINDNPTDDQVPSILPVPNVTGIEILGQGNNTDFTGPDVTIAWRRTSDREWKDPITGKPVGSGAQDQYFSHYQILVYDNTNGELLREAIRTTPQLTYSLSMNEEDSNKNDRANYRALAGPRRVLRFEVFQWSRQNRSSPVAARLTVQNPAPSDLTGVQILEGAYSAKFSYNRPTDADFVGMDVWVSTSPGFTPSDANLFMHGPDTALTMVNLTAGTNYYLRYRPYDAFGPGTMGPELQFTSLAIPAEDLSGLGPWATRVDPVDAAFITAQLEADSIDSTKIANLAVGKLTAGVLLVTMTIQSAGSIRITQGSYETRLGVHNVSGTDYAIRTTDGVTSPFSVTAAGILNAVGANISGTVNITSGSGYANIGDRPADYLVYNNFSRGSLFKDDFDLVGAENAWQNYQTGEMTRVAASDASGGYVLQCGNNSGADGVYAVCYSLIAYDPNKTYEVKFRLRQVAGSGTAYLGVMGVAADGVTLVNATGSNSTSSQHYIAASGETIPSSWTEYVGYISGLSGSGNGGVHGDPDSPATAHTNVRYLRILALVNYSNQTGRVDIDSMEINEVTPYQNIRNTPTSLSGINTTEGTKLGGIAVGATANLTLVQGANVTVVGNKVTKVTGNGSWNAEAYSKESYVGGAYVTFTADQNNASIMVGLNTDPTTDANYTSIDYALYIRNDGTVYVYNNGSSQGQKSASYAAGDVFSVIYDGSSVTYYQNGVSIFSQSASAGQRFYLDSSFNILGSVSGLTFGPMTIGSTAALNGGVTITGGGITMSAGGSIKGGKTTPGSGVGFFLGYSSGAYRFDVGDYAAEKYMYFDGTDLILGKDTKLISALTSNSSDSFRTQTKNQSADMTSSTSGSVTLDFSLGVLGAAINNGATAGAFVQSFYQTHTVVLSAQSWSKNREMMFAAEAYTFQSVVNGYIGCGQFTSTNRNQKHIGIEFTSTNIKATVANGTSETTLNLAAFSTGKKVYRIDHKQGQVDFYIDGTLAGSITTNIPTGADNNAQAFPWVRISTSGTTSTSNNALSLGEWKFRESSA